MLFDRLPRGNRLAVLSNAGFECSSVLDKLYGLVPARLSRGDEGAARRLPARRRPRGQPRRRDADGDDPAVRRGRGGDARGRRRRRPPRLADPGDARRSTTSRPTSRAAAPREHPLAGLPPAASSSRSSARTGKPIAVVASTRGASTTTSSRCSSGAAFRSTGRSTAPRAPSRPSPPSDARGPAPGRGNGKGPGGPLARRVLSSRPAGRPQRS